MGCYSLCGPLGPSGRRTSAPISLGAASAGLSWLQRSAQAKLGLDWLEACLQPCCWDMHYITGWLFLNTLPPPADYSRRERNAAICLKAVANEEGGSKKR